MPYLHHLLSENDRAILKKLNTLRKDSYAIGSKYFEFLFKATSRELEDEEIAEISSLIAELQ